MNGLLKYGKAFHNCYSQGFVFKWRGAWSSEKSQDLPTTAHSGQDSGDLTQVWLTSRHLLTRFCLSRKRCTYHFGSSRSFRNFQQLCRTLLGFLLPGVHPDPGPRPPPKRLIVSQRPPPAVLREKLPSQGTVKIPLQTLLLISAASSLLSSEQPRSVASSSLCAGCAHLQACPGPFPFSLCFKNPQHIFKDLVHSSPSLEPSLTSPATCTHTKAKFVDSHCPCNTRCFLHQGHGTFDCNCLLAVSPTSLGGPSGHWFDFGILSPQ